MLHRTPLGCMRVDRTLPALRLFLCLTTSFGYLRLLSPSHRGRCGLHHGANLRSSGGDRERRKHGRLLPLRTTCRRHELLHRHRLLLCLWHHGGLKHLKLVLCRRLLSGFIFIFLPLRARSLPRRLRHRRGGLLLKRRKSRLWHLQERRHEELSRLWRRDVRRRPRLPRRSLQRDVRQLAKRRSVLPSCTRSNSSALRARSALNPGTGGLQLRLLLLNVSHRTRWAGCWSSRARRTRPRSAPKLRTRSRHGDRGCRRDGCEGSLPPAARRSRRGSDWQRQNGRRTGRRRGRRWRRESRLAAKEEIVAET